jgi:hypothetical protein
MTVTGRTHFGWDLTDISVIMVELSVLFAAASIRSTEPHRFQFPFEALDFRSEGLNMIFVLHTLKGNFLRCDDFVVRLVYLFREVTYCLYVSVLPPTSCRV